MLETFLRYAQGFVAIPVVVALRKRGLFDLLDRRGPLTVGTLASDLHANEGHLAIALRLVEALGWIGLDAGGRVGLTASAALLGSIPHDIDAIAGGDGLESAAGLEPWLDLSARRWNTPHAQLADWLDGVLALPVLVAARRLDLFAPQAEGRAFAALPPAVRAAITR